MSTVQKLLDLLSPSERRGVYLILGMIMVTALLDATGVASVAPFMTVLANPGVVETNQYLGMVYTRLGFESTGNFLAFLGFVVFGTVLASVLFKALTMYALLRFTHMRNYSIGKRLVAGYLRQPYDWFLDRHSADLGKNALSEVRQVIGGSLVPFMQLMAHGAVALTLVALLVVVDLGLALMVGVVIGGAYALFYWLLRRYLERTGSERVLATRETFNVMQETFGGIKDVKIGGREQAMLKRFEAPAYRFARCQTASELSAELPRFALEIIAFAAVFGVALYLKAQPGGLQEALPVLSVFAFAGYRLIQAVQKVYAQLSAIRFTGPALHALHKDYVSLSQQGDEIVPGERTAPLGIREGIRLEELSYSYPKSEHGTLKSITLDISACTTVGLVGATGSGKTTTVDVVLGLLRPQTGRLLVDGEPITRENVRAWQRTIGYVPQHIYLADDTVTANIAFGVPPQEVDRRAVERASRIANLHEFVVEEMPSGYDTTVGERGVRLSGGQRQRIGIARALYHDPAVLILDEATSALDNLTERAVMEAVRNLGHRKTIIIVAHRLSTVRDCDRIFVLEKGRVVEQGTFDQLVHSNGRFRAMAGGQVG